MMIVDIDLNQLRLLSRGGSNLLRWDKDDKVYLYYVTQAPVVFRTILPKPKNEQEQWMLDMTLPSTIKVLNVIEPHMLPLMMLEQMEDLKLKLEEMKNVRDN